MKPLIAVTILGSILSTALSAEYGVDVSFPMHEATVSENYDWLPHNQDPSLETPDKYKGMVVQPLGNRQVEYEKMMKGCYETYSEFICHDYERDRVAMNRRQPQSMTNYTDLGFKKIRTPENVWKLIKDFWDNNSEDQSTEKWPKGNTYTNHWDSETRILSVENSKLRGGGARLKQAIWDAARDTIQEWTGEELTQCSLYGIRIYTEGSVLSSHVDRLPLVSSAIINVDSDVSEPWPLEVIGHDGRAHNVTMEPGDMVLYESHSVIHGRPFPLKGNYVANLFVHFEPTGHSLRHEAKVGLQNPDQQYKESIEKGLAGHESDHDGLPPYLIPGSPEESNWRKRHPKGSNRKTSFSETGSTIAHQLAQKGNLSQLKEHVEKDPKLAHATDLNGWTPFHEAVRGGHVEAAQFLHEQGAKINQRTQGGKGGTPLYYAQSKFGDDHPIVDWLLELGAESLGPEL